MEEGADLWQTRVHSDGAFVPPSFQPTENENALHYGFDEVDFPLWLLTDDEEQEDDTTAVSSEVAQNPPNQVSEASTTLSDISMTGDLSVLGNSLPAQVQGSQTQQVYENAHPLAPLGAVSMAEFMQNQQEHIMGGFTPDNQLGQYSIDTINQEDYPLINWQPDAPIYQEPLTALEQACAPHPDDIDLNVFNFAESELPFAAGFLPYSQYPTPSVGGFGGFHDALPDSQNADTEHLLNHSDSPSELNEPMGQDSPTFQKQCRRQTALDQANKEKVSSIAKPAEDHSRSQASQPGLQVATPAENDNGEEEEGLTTEEISAICKSYVSEHYYPPSSEASILPRYSQPPKEMTTWLDRKIAQKKDKDATTGFDGPQVLQYDPLEDLTPANEQHEAARCARAANLVFQQDVTGQGDWYDHSMAGVYHFIPKSETDKWHDDSNFLVSDQEFESLINDMYKDDKNAGAEQGDDNISKVAEDVTVNGTFTTPGANVSEQSVKETEPLTADQTITHQVSLDRAVRQSETSEKKEATLDPVSPDQLVRLLESFVETDAMPERAPNQSIKEAESSPRKKSLPKKTHQLTPPGGHKRKVAKLDATPQHSPSAVESHDSMSADSFKTAHGSPQVIDLTSDTELLPIPSFHTDPPNTPNRRTSHQSKRSNGRHGAHEKTTKNIFAVVENRDAKTPGSGSSGGTLPRTLQPSPLAGYSARSYHEYPRVAPSSLGSPTAPSRGRSGLNSSFIPAAQNNQSFAHQPDTRMHGPTMPTMAAFMPHQASYSQQSQQFGDRRFDSASNNHLDVRGNGGGNRQQMGFSQPEMNRGQGYAPHATPQNNMQRHMAPSMQSLAQPRAEPYHPYSGSPQGQYSHSRMSPGARSSDSTISATSQSHSPQGIPRQGNQPPTPSKKRNVELKRMPSASEPSPSPPMTTQLSGPRKSGDRLDSTPSITSNAPSPAVTNVSIEVALIRFRRDKERERALKILQKAVNASPEKNIKFRPIYIIRPKMITLTAPAGNMLRGWVLNILPNVEVQMFMEVEKVRSNEITGG